MWRGAVGSYPGGGEWLITDVFFFTSRLAKNKGGGGGLISRIFTVYCS